MTRVITETYLSAILNSSLCNARLQMKPLTWQPARIQTDGEWLWAETVLCSSVGQDEHLQETDGKLDTHPRRCPKHRCAARKATLTDAAKREPDAGPQVKQTKASTAEMPAMTQNRTSTARSMLTGTGTQFVCLCHWLL